MLSIGFQYGDCFLGPHYSRSFSLWPHDSAAFCVGMLASDGRCKTLDASADGYVRAEAVGTVLLQTVSTADTLAKPDSAEHILILGAAVNQDGRSSSLTAPNGPAQQALIKTALSTAHLPAGKVRILSLAERQTRHLAAPAQFTLFILCW